MSVPVAPPAFASSPGTTRLMESIATLQNYYEAHGSSTKSTTDQPEDASFATNPVGDYCLRKYGDGELEGDRDRDKPAPSKQISKPCFESSELFAAPKPGVKAPRYHLETDSDSEHEGLLLRGQEEKILDSPVRAVVVDEKAADDKTPPFSAYAESKYERSKASKSTSGGASAAAMDLLLREEEDEGAVGILADAAAPSAEIKSHQSGADKEDGKAAEAPVTSAAADVSKITTPRNKPAAGTSASPAIKRTSHELEKDPVFPSPSREEILSAEQVCKQIESLHLAVDAEGTGKLFAAVSLLTSLQEKEAKKKQDLLSYYEAKCKRLEAEMLSASVENGAFAKNSFAQFEMERGVYEKRIAELERRSEDFEEVAQRQANLLEAAESELAVLRRRCAKQDEDVARLEGQCRRQLSDFRKVKFAPPLRSGAGEQAEAPAVRDLCDEVNELCDQVAGTVPTIPAADRSVHEPVEESGSSFLDNVDVSKVEHVSEVVDGTRELRSGTDVIDDVGAARDHAQSPVAQSQLERSFQRHKERIHAMRKTSADYSTSAEGKAKAKVHARREPSPGSGGKKSGVGRGAGGTNAKASSPSSGHSAGAKAKGKSGLESKGAAPTQPGDAAGAATVASSPSAHAKTKGRTATSAPRPAAQAHGRSKSSSGLRGRGPSVQRTTGKGSGFEKPHQKSSAAPAAVAAARTEKRKGSGARGGTPQSRTKKSAAAGVHAGPKASSPVAKAGKINVAVPTVSGNSGPNFSSSSRTGSKTSHEEDSTLVATPRQGRGRRPRGGSSISKEEAGDHSHDKKLIIIDDLVCDRGPSPCKVNESTAPVCARPLLFSPHERSPIPRHDNWTQRPCDNTGIDNPSFILDRSFAGAGAGADVYPPPGVQSESLLRAADTHTRPAAGAPELCSRAQIVLRRHVNRSEKIMWRLDNASATIREHPTGTCLLSPTFFYEPTPQSRIKIEFEFFPNGSDTSCSIFPAGTSAADCTSTNTVSPGSPPSTAEAMLMRFRERNQSILDKLASPPLAPSSEHGATGGGQLAGPMKASNGSASINTRIVRRRAGSASGGAAAPAASSSSNFSATLNGAPVYTNCSLQIRLFAPVATRFYAFLGNQKSEVQEGCGWRKKDKPFEVLCHFDRTGQIDGEDTLDVGVTLLLE